MGQIRYKGIKIIQVTTSQGIMYEACGTLWSTIEDAKRAIRESVIPNK